MSGVQSAPDGGGRGIHMSGRVPYHSGYWCASPLLNPPRFQSIAAPAGSSRRRP
eukprot:CAMPEP_0115836168 /NCGR_PEP_ID=MMETSP0287-20121206/4569_1 /TAXON_ID=412157 /ORGANISM="Chrysochromulina rotalis, Strain UIO044" /LENGTH=53 /DNA_ID=CAMNT_0003289645 /DNA_START=1180 /DNA_END=1338 /DNA_ORIENTATION=+